MYYFRKINLLNRKKPDPNTFVFTGTSTTDKTELQLFEYSKDTVEEKNNVELSDIGDLGSTDKFSWLNIYGLNDTDLIATLCKKQNIDNLVIQDLLDVNQRPKFQEFDNYCFLTLKTTRPKSDEMIVEQISFIFTDKYLISFQERKADYFDHLRYRLRENKGIIRERGPDFLLYNLLEAILDNYFRTLDRISKEVEKINLENIKTDPSPSVLEEIEKHRVSVHFIKNAIQPIKEFTLKNERDAIHFIEQRNLKFFYEINDLCLTLLDNCDTIFASLESSTNLFFSVQGHKMNQVMKTLTIVATIFIPLTFVAGIYGMNFKYMPELEWQYGYAAIWGVIILILISMVIYFKKKNWF